MPTTKITPMRLGPETIAELQFIADRLGLSSITEVVRYLSHTEYVWQTERQRMIDRAAARKENEMKTATKSESSYIDAAGNTVEETKYTETIADGIIATTLLYSQPEGWRCYYEKGGEIIASGYGASRKRAESNAWSQYQDWLSDNES